MATARHFLRIFLLFYCFIRASENNLMAKYNLAKVEVEGSSPFFRLIFLFIGFFSVLSHDASTSLPFNSFQRFRKIQKCFEGIVTHDILDCW